MIRLFSEILLSINIVDIIDILIISIIVYKLLQLMRGTRTVYMVFSILVILIMLLASRIIGLRTTNWILSNVTGYLFFMIIVLFQPELRKALQVLGESRLFKGSHEISYKMSDEIVRTATILANRQIGALIVMQRDIDVIQYTQNLGQKIDGEVSRDLLMSIFIPYSPLHDGAVLIINSRLAYAGSILPLTKREDIPKSFGTRHRAGIGISEETDALVIVVSEERGSISVITGGHISSDLDGESLRNAIDSLMKVAKPEAKHDK